MEKAKTYSAVGALLVAAILAFLSFHVKNDISANMLVLVAQFLLYSLTLFGFGEIVRYIVNTVKSHEDRTIFRARGANKDELSGGE